MKGPNFFWIIDGLRPLHAMDVHALPPRFQLMICLKIIGGVLDTQVPPVESGSHNQLSTIFVQYLQGDTHEC